MDGRVEKNCLKTTFRVECVKKGVSRKVWMRKDTPRFHGDEIQVAGGPNTPTVCVKDRLEIPINLCSGQCVLNPSSATWLEPRIVTEPEDRALGQKCLLDAEGIQWFDYDTFRSQCGEVIQDMGEQMVGDDLLPFCHLSDLFRPYWILKESEYSGVSVLISKSKYAVVATGESLRLSVDSKMVRRRC